MCADVIVVGVYHYLFKFITLVILLLEVVEGFYGILEFVEKFLLVVLFVLKI